MDDTKHADFVRIRDSRLPKATKAIGLLANLAGSGYASTPEEQDALVAALQDAVDAVARKFGRDPANRGATHGLVLGDDNSVWVVDMNEPSPLTICYLIDRLAVKNSLITIRDYVNGALEGFKERV